MITLQLTEAAFSGGKKIDQLKVKFSCKYDVFLIKHRQNMRC